MRTPTKRTGRYFESNTSRTEAAAFVAKLRSIDASSATAASFPRVFCRTAAASAVRFFLANQRGDSGTNCKANQKTNDGSTCEPNIQRQLLAPKLSKT